MPVNDNLNNIQAHQKNHPHADHRVDSDGQVVLGAVGGVPAEIDYSQTADATSIPIRDAAGQLEVPLVPTSDQHVPSKKYVDEAVISAEAVGDPDTPGVTLLVFSGRIQTVGDYLGKVAAPGIVSASGPLTRFPIHADGEIREFSFDADSRIGLTLRLRRTDPLAVTTDQDMLLQSVGGIREFATPFVVEQEDYVEVFLQDKGLTSGIVNIRMVFALHHNSGGGGCNINFNGQTTAPEPPLTSPTALIEDGAIIPAFNHLGTALPFNYDNPHSRLMIPIPVQFRSLGYTTSHATTPGDNTTKWDILAHFNLQRTVTQDAADGASAFATPINLPAGTTVRVRRPEQGGGTAPSGASLCLSGVTA